MQSLSRAARTRSQIIPGSDAGPPDPVRTSATAHPIAGVAADNFIDAIVRRLESSDGQTGLSVRMLPTPAVPRRDSEEARPVGEVRRHEPATRGDSATARPPSAERVDLEALATRVGEMLARRNRIERERRGGVA